MNFIFRFLKMVALIIFLGNFNQLKTFRLNFTRLFQGKYQIKCYSKNLQFKVHLYLMGNFCYLCLKMYLTLSIFILIL
jgi:hypothetical protein